MEFNLLEWFGYLASVVILISLLSSSIIKLRWINLVGAALFATYGALLGSIPVAVLNGGIVIINVYYLIKIYSAKEYLHLLELTPDSNYFAHFIEFFKEDIESYFKRSDFKNSEDIIGFYILRNTVTAALFLATRRDDNSLNVELDYAVSEYRDFKTGKFIYEKHKDFFLSRGYSRLFAVAHNDSHEKYLRKMGFSNLSNSKEYVLELK